MIRFPGKTWLNQFNSLQYVHQKIIGWQVRRDIRAELRSGEKADVTFTCNLCGHRVSAPVTMVAGRETRSCYHCGSTQRMRWLVHLLSTGLYHQSLPIPEFPLSTLKGIGMSDPYPLASRLKKRINYLNTYYHRAPRLDITDPNVVEQGPYDFIITSDVLEHVAPPIEVAFEHIYNLLNPGGFLILTVPFKTDVTETSEHFPNLYKYKILNRGGIRSLINITIGGEEEIFDDLIFHGGQGTTLEMRSISRDNLLTNLSAAGFVEIEFLSEDYPDIGIIQQPNNSPALTARRPKTRLENRTLTASPQKVSS